MTDNGRRAPVAAQEAQDSEETTRVTNRSPRSLFSDPPDRQVRSLVHGRVKRLERAQCNALAGVGRHRCNGSVIAWASNNRSNGSPWCLGSFATCAACRAPTGNSEKPLAGSLRAGCRGDDAPVTYSAKTCCKADNVARKVAGLVAPSLFTRRALSSVRI